MTLFRKKLTIKTDFLTATSSAPSGRFGRGKACRHAIGFDL